MSDRANNEALEVVIARIQSVYGRWRRHTPVEEMRRDWDNLFWSDRVPCKIEDEVVDGVPVRWITAPDVRNDLVLIYLHGGGYKMGSLISHHDLMARLSVAADCRVLGVGYRLLPEHQFPAPVEDVLTVYNRILDLGYTPERLAIAGDSAGGGLAASTLLAIRDKGQRLPAAAVMLSAWTDLAAEGPSYETRASTDPIHQRPMIQALASQYLGVDGNLRDPLASALYGDLAGLPPLLLQVGDRETGLDDSTLFAEKARSAGVEVDLEVWNGMIHVFQQFAEELPEAREAIARIGDFLNRRWGAT
ncbi:MULTISPECIES: alpha/beta hydrolase [unclassified Pseudomonas]|uniref:alpha/beta hydrolase n=1 Tax=unclassified Pseudomonas TaxID=196821 RepID=UPI000C88204F|nr:MULTISPECIES: alpha/beta hydrolase [unclassified Pseudomonas]PMX27454.1 alpha/beta hydrolase [Pseudomonas sp. GW460-12]PMX34478.1 alpha/beta hydrolase [Pseudomonas sp. MPR-R2A4]PMX41885.1 alpha/beta hydrolase [Pseudomonas sp. MPR-R2A7]PMX53841.1 alpha/beta hydrolase [Pseudomonas sp. MPR-R2A6]PMX91322.1 alpha/beta hydrolase [Pseudomonas sp. MPR-R2A3]